MEKHDVIRLSYYRMLEVARNMRSGYLADEISGYASYLKDDRWLQRVSFKNYTNGDYLGEINSYGQKHGVGMYFWDDRAIYFGDWYNDERSGEGIYIYKNNDVYYGGFKNGMKHGHGHYVYHFTGQESEGNYSNGEEIHNDYVRQEDGRYERNHNNSSIFFGYLFYFRLSLV